MREMNLLEALSPRNSRERSQVIQTSASRKVRPEDEMIILMRSARRRFKKYVAEGKIEIVSEREWTLR
ncbi:hypothetical protein D3H35_21220 [Cohnella faecalis]|uniref:Uncharacterized protein n=1 Tax=Cohnella faecalis TaxID=2315694 RepID=A0A398CLF9_9BACL|nr:hypothetical protein D3H35_21220 [Cohnella faecalis]